MVLIIKQCPNQVSIYLGVNGEVELYGESFDGDLSRACGGTGEVDILAVEVACERECHVKSARTFHIMVREVAKVDGVAIDGSCGLVGGVLVFVDDGEQHIDCIVGGSRSDVGGQMKHHAIDRHPLREVLGKLRRVGGAVEVDIAVKITDELLVGRFGFWLGIFAARYESHSYAAHQQYD